MYAVELRCFELIRLGGEEESWLWQCMQTYKREAKPGSGCVWRTVLSVHL